LQRLLDEHGDALPFLKRRKSNSSNLNNSIPLKLKEHSKDNSPSNADTETLDIQQRTRPENNIKLMNRPATDLSQNREEQDAVQNNAEFQARGGLGEPYCSKACSNKAVKEIEVNFFATWHGVGRFCHVQLLQKPP